MSGNLRGRVAAQRDKQENGTGAEVEKRGNGQPANVYEFIEGMKGQIARALPKHLNADRLARIVLTEVRRTPLLAHCTPDSFGGAIMTCAQLGLEPGVTGEAYLLPFRNKKKQIYEVQLVIGYKGMIKLFWQSPLAKSLDAQTVYQADEFEYEYGLEPKLRHKPRLVGDRGKPIAYYAVATMTNGGSAFIVMSPGDIEKIRERSRAKDDGPWMTDYDQMAKKTAIRQLFKLLPQSPELARAIAADESVRTDMSEDALDVPQSYPDAISGEIEQEVAPEIPASRPTDAEVVVEDPPADLFPPEDAA